MASAPDESGATAELQQLKVQDDDYNPFTEEDLQKILHEEQNNSAEEGWSFVKRNESCEIWRKNERDKPVHLIKGFLNFPGIPPEKVVEMIHNLDVRKEWDKQFPVIEVLEHHKHYRVVYWLVKMPPLVADRDIVQYIGRRHDEDTNTTYLLYRNATHSERPERKGIVRAETILSGVIIRPDPEDPTNSTKMSIMLQNDAKGWIPHFIVNKFAANAPIDWHNSLAGYYSNVYSQRGKPKEEESTQRDQSTTEEAESKGQSADAAEGGETEGQSADAEGGENQVTGEGDQKAEMEDQPVTTEVKVESTSADTAGGAGDQGEAPTESGAHEEGSKTEDAAEQ